LSIGGVGARAEWLQEEGRGRRFASVKETKDNDAGE